MKWIPVIAAWALVSIPAHAQICPASNATGFDGIGDGCSTHYAEYVIPPVGMFKGSFTSACNAHDKCYSSLGTDYSSCDSRLYSDMRSACSSNFNPLLLPSVYLDCLATANLYSTAVAAWRGSNQVHVTNLQNDALNRSIQTQNSVNADSCGTTPERTTIYAPSVITRVNSAFASAAGRQPTIYEFFDAVNWQSGASNFVSDPAGWQAALYTKASVAASVTPPPVGWVKTKPQMYAVLFTANPNLAGASYRWRTTTGSGTGPSITFNFRPPTNSYAQQFSGFVKATSGGVSNMALIETSTWLIGTSCAPSGPPVPCD